MTDSEGWFQTQSTRFRDSAKDALSPWNLAKRFILAVLFGAILGLKELVYQLDLAGKSGATVMGFVKAIIIAEKSGLATALGSLWNIILQFSNNQISWNLVGSLGFSLIMIVALFGFWLQPVSFFLNLFDGQKGQGFGIIARSFATILLIILLSAIAFYSGSGEIITTNYHNLTGNLGNIDNATIQQVINDVPIIDLTGGGS